MSQTSRIDLLAHSKQGYEVWLDSPDRLVYIELGNKRLRTMTFEEFYSMRVYWASVYKLVPTECFKEMIREIENDPEKFREFPLAYKWNAQRNNKPR